MPFSTDNLIGTISRTGLMRPSNFRCTMTLPQSFLQYNRTNENNRLLEYYTSVNDLSIRINRFTIPADTLTTSEYLSDFRGNHGIAVAREYEDLAIGIILSSDGRERELFQQWIEYINGSGSNYKTRYYDDYVAPVVNIEVLKQDGSYGFSHKYFNAYPKTVGDIELSYDETDTYSTVAITMGYETHRRGERPEPTTESVTSNVTNNDFSEFTT